MKVLTGGRIPIKGWVDDFDESMVDQARHLADLPFAFSHIAIMPDAHRGYGMPIGGVLATQGVVIPHAVGVDIGCGVRAWPTGLDSDEFIPRRRQVLNDIQRSVPTGFSRRDRPQDHPVFDDVPDSGPIVQHLDIAKESLGTLGGGNHFIEIQRDDEGAIWAMLHSGSRNLGKQVCDHYDRLARELGSRIGSEVPEAWQLAYLPLETDEGRAYLEAMRWCLRFAKANRDVMMEHVRMVFDRHLAGHEPGRDIDVHHNYAAVERHFGEEVVVHRKGAVHAVGTVIVPGSMGTPSYVCTGLADPESFESCAHGAGRSMGRKEAKRSIPVQDVILDLRRRDVELFMASKRDVAEECPQAYKDIDRVMELQTDLVRPEIRLVPLGVVKG